MAETADIVHLLRRTEFVARPSRVAELTLLALSDAVDNVLDISKNGVTTVPASLLRDDLPNRWEQYKTACAWWVDNMRSRARPIEEKMTLFWHGHFVSSVNGAGSRVDLMMRQNQLYRSHALGNFVSLTHQMAIDPAMLLYLSNATNVKAAPNENFARELMELFTLGVGNYTQDDVAAAARAWTGHHFDWPANRYVFRSAQHDDGLKTFFGVTKNWDGPQIIDEILVNNLTKRRIAARFMVKKLWEFFAHQDPPSAVTDALADVFLANRLEIKPLLRALFNRPEFYATAAKQGLVRSPTDFAVALLHHANLSASALGLAWRGPTMGQALLYPPNVDGWKTNGYWLNTSAVAGRAHLAWTVATLLRKNGGFDYIYSMSTSAAVDHVAGLFGIDALSTATRDAMIRAHQAEKDTTPWNEWWAPTNLLTMTMMSPEFHMA